MSKEDISEIMPILRKPEKIIAINGSSYPMPENSAIDYLTSSRKSMNSLFQTFVKSYGLH